MTSLWLIDRRQTEPEPERTQNAVDRCLCGAMARIDGSRKTVPGYAVPTSSLQLGEGQYNQAPF